MTINLPDSIAREFAQVFCCNLGSFPFKYLGVPLHFGKQRKEDLQPVIDQIIKKISGWRGKLISYEGKLILIRACLASIPTYLMSVLKFPKWVINAIYSQMAHFFGGGLDDHHRYHLANWGLITRKKEFGGLDVPNLRDMNLCLLGSWFKRFFNAEDKIWKRIVSYKYNTSPNLCWISDHGSSPFWKSLCWAAPSVRTGYNWKLGNGNKMLFWLDTWVSHCSLATLFWDLFSICNEPMATVDQVLVDGQVHLSFRRCFSPHMIGRWDGLCSLLLPISLSDEMDIPVWVFETSGVYSVKSFYRIVSDGGIRVPHLAAIWKIQIPGRVHVFLWLLFQNRLLTRDNLAKRRHVHDLSCLFCDDPETSVHSFFDCVVATQTWKMVRETFPCIHMVDFNSLYNIWLSNDPMASIITASFLWSLWKIRNDMHFQGRKWSSLLLVWDRATSMLRSWAPLLKESNSRLMDRSLRLLDIKRGELLRIA
jgi:hypothetical protein